MIQAECYPSDRWSSYVAPPVAVVPFRYPLVSGGPAMSNPRPRKAPTSYHSPASEYEPVLDGAWIWCPLKAEWRSNKPEERVRQRFILRLIRDYGYSQAQMDQERRTKHGRQSPKADIVIWSEEKDVADGRAPSIVVECKAEDVTIDPEDYEQGDSYARAIGEPCDFLVMHNDRETRFFKITRGLPGTREEIENIPSASDWADQSTIERIRKATKAFTRDEFRRLLRECHDILRDNHKLDPGRAFDAISKILFIKMWVERTGEHDRFTEEYLAEYSRIRRRNADEVLDDLFSDTKRYYSADDLFGAEDRLEISFATFKRIVGKLSRFDLSRTSDDVKGIAFESFLGQTFRGELGQFFTPRPIVDFMVEMLDPQEGEVVCDPASGSGGFLIRVFEHVRGRISNDIRLKKNAARADLAKRAKKEGWSEDALEARIDEALRELSEELDVGRQASRLWRTAHECIFGTDAEARAARTSKMNMIMHGDGHGGIHHHDGFVDVNGIFPGRFDVVLTNPPFGATVRKDQKVGDTAGSRVTSDPARIREYEGKFGTEYSLAHGRMSRAAEARAPILSLFDIGVDPVGAEAGSGKVRNSRPTEMLFLERCIDLLRPGGRLGIVLPDGVLNNPSNAWLRDYCESRAVLTAVVSIPMEVFASSDATVKTSLVFLRRFTQREETEWAEAVAGATAALAPQYERRRKEVEASFQTQMAEASGSKKTSLRAELRKEVKKLDGEEAEAVRAAARERFDYDVFMAIAESAGITATGDTGSRVPNDLPEIRDAFRAWVAGQS